MTSVTLLARSSVRLAKNIKIISIKYFTSYPKERRELVPQKNQSISTVFFGRLPKREKGTCSPKKSPVMGLKLI